VVKAGVEVRLNNRVTTEFILRNKPDVLILATGSVPSIPDTPGVERDNVVTAMDVLTGKEQVGDKVVIIGGGMVGCETAEFLMEKGKKVTILEMLERIGQDIGPAARWRIIRRLRETGVGMETKIKAEEITEEGVRASRQGSPELFPADSIVLATGMIPDKMLARELAGKVPAVHLVGDCVQSRRIEEALEEGYRIGARI
jgi:2,4-dienoyl-CoA reductase (NADPH2)